MSGLAALHAAALAGGGSVVEALLDAGVDTSALTPDGRTALDLARASLAESTGESAWRPEPAPADAAPWEQRQAIDEQRASSACSRSCVSCVNLLAHDRT